MLVCTSCWQRQIQTVSQNFKSSAAIDVKVDIWKLYKALGASQMAGQQAIWLYELCQFHLNQNSPLTLHVLSISKSKTEPTFCLAIPPVVDPLPCFLSAFGCLHDGKPPSHQDQLWVCDEQIKPFANLSFL